MSSKIPLYKNDGSLNVKKMGVPNQIFTDFYYHLLKMSWTKFLLFVMALYLCLNSLFAALYYFLPTAIQNAQSNSYWDNWVFSFQTSTTLGYGYLYPTNTLTNIVAVFDVITGILFVAIATGIAFTKLSRPSSKVLFSKNILISNYEGTPTLTLRIGNQRTNEVIDAQVKMVCLKSSISEEGVKMRRILDLKLERERTPLFTLSWTLFHKIDESSPLYGLSKEDIINDEISFILSFTGIDDVFSATIHDRHIYSSESIVFNQYFEDIILTDTLGNRVIDYSKFHQLKSVI